MVTFNNDLDVLNYALTLEHFENALYKTLISANLLSGTEQQYLVTFGQHEAAHVQALTQTIQSLGGTPVAAQSAYNFGAAGVKDRQSLLSAIQTVEDVGASAYLGAAGFLQNKDLLEVAVNIHNVEAEHAAVWRYVLGIPAAPDTVAKGRTPDEVLAIVTPFLQAPATTAPATTAPATTAPATTAPAVSPPTSTTATPGNPGDFTPRRLGQG